VTFFSKVSNRQSVLIFIVTALVAFGGTKTAQGTVVNFGLGADDYGQLAINGQPICTYDNIFAAGGCTGSVDLVPGVWYEITIDYRNRAGSNGLALTWDQPGDPNNGGYGFGPYPNLAPLASLRTVGSSGAYVNGLRGEYYDSARNLQSTTVGEGPINAINAVYNNQNVGSWNGYGYFSTFEERLSGQIRIADECTATSIPTPPSGRVSNPAHPWTFDYEVTARDGLVIRNVILGQRLMAREMSLPYFHVTDRHGRILARCELQPDGIASVCRSRLVGFQQISSPTALIVQADFAIDNLPGSPDACLHIQQQYVFEDEFSLACEPTASIPCARFFPLVKYRVNQTNGEIFAGGINVVQRFHFDVDGAVANAVAIFKDHSTIRRDSPVTALPNKEDNPLQNEVVLPAIRMGKAGRADNLHQTSKPSIQEPLLVPPVPGCPECVHVHWTWSRGATFIGGPQFGNGDPLIGAGSTQDVDVAVTVQRPGEVHPFDFRSLVGVESVVGAPSVFWYFAQGHQPEDTFFLHGGFFLSRPQ
jgi:hypothetical protein